MLTIARLLLVALLLAPLTLSSAQDGPPQPPAKHLILLDTDLGPDVDDALALALVLASPELELRGVTTVGGQADDRAVLACRFLAQMGRRDVPVAIGKAPQPDYGLDWQIQYRRHPAAIFNR